MTIYKHTQRGTPTITVIGGGVALLAGLAVYMYQTGHEAAWAPTAVAAILVVTLLIFHSLNVEVGDGELRLHYGIGFECVSAAIEFPIQRAEIAQHIGYVVE